MRDGRRSTRGHDARRAAGRAATAAALLVLAAAVTPATARGQESAGAGGGGDGGAPSYGAFVYVEQTGAQGGVTRLLVGPDVNSTLNEGARLFLRCRGDRREVFVAHTSKILGNAEQGAGGRTRFDRLRWSDLIRWGANEAGSAAFLPPRRVAGFMAQARGHSMVEIQLVNPAGVSRTFEFDLEGLGEGLQHLACFGG